MATEVLPPQFGMVMQEGKILRSFTPIINPPEAAILGVGRIVERIARRDADLVWQQMMTLSLTFDHRVVDGAPAAAFLQTICEFLASPEGLIQ